MNKAGESAGEQEGRRQCTLTGTQANEKLGKVIVRACGQQVVKQIGSRANNETAGRQVINKVS